MNKVHSGTSFMLAGVAMSILVQLNIRALGEVDLVALCLIASVSLVLFGVFQVITGLKSH